jgi:hypothetical protein
MCIAYFQPITCGELSSFFGKEVSRDTIGVLRDQAFIACPLARCCRLMRLIRISDNAKSLKTIGQYSCSLPNLQGMVFPTLAERIPPD